MRKYCEMERHTRITKRITSTIRQTILTKKNYCIYTYTTCIYHIQRLPRLSIATIILQDDAQYKVEKSANHIKFDVYFIYFVYICNECVCVCVGWLDCAVYFLLVYHSVIELFCYLCTLVLYVGWLDCYFFPF